MTRRCRWLLVLGCWSLSLVVAPDSWDSMGSTPPSTVYQAAHGGPARGDAPGRPVNPGPASDVRIAEKPQ